MNLSSDKISKSLIQSKLKSTIFWRLFAYAHIILYILLFCNNSSVELISFFRKSYSLLSAFLLFSDKLKISIIHSISPISMILLFSENIIGLSPLSMFVSQIIFLKAFGFSTIKRNLSFSFSSIINW